VAEEVKISDGLPGVAPGELAVAHGRSDVLRGNEHVIQAKAVDDPQAIPETPDARMWTHRSLFFGRQSGHQRKGGLWVRSEQETGEPEADRAKPKSERRRAQQTRRAQQRQASRQERQSRADLCVCVCMRERNHQ
jgi:hypothetical protein